jgi:SAM-dependent methyltransferase
VPEERIDRTRANWAVREPLRAWIAAEAVRAHADLGRYRVLDVGCGFKPYEPLFAPYADAYVGVDSGDHAAPDLIGTAEAIPVEDASFDVVICSQVLEHVDDPARVVAELYRVTAPGGRVLASTHGVQLYHPSPQDLWRWTHAGLARLFDQNAAWSSVTVTPGAGTTATLGLLLATYVDLVFQHLHARPLGRPLIVVLNTVAAAIDARSATLRGLGPGSLIANYHVVAEKPR